MFWSFVINLAFVFIGNLLYKPPPGPAARSAQDFASPKSSEGSPIYDGAGTFWVKDPHVIWEGDFATKGIYKKGGKK